MNKELSAIIVDILARERDGLQGSLESVIQEVKTAQGSYPDYVREWLQMCLQNKTYYDEFKVRIGDRIWDVLRGLARADRELYADLIGRLAKDQRAGVVTLLRLGIIAFPVSVLLAGLVSGVIRLSFRAPFLSLSSATMGVSLLQIIGMIVCFLMFAFAVIAISASISTLIGVRKYIKQRNC